MLPRNHPDRRRVSFDDHRLVANTGLLLPATLAQHLNQNQGEMRIRRIVGDRGSTDIDVRTGELYLTTLPCPHHLRNLHPTLAFSISRAWRSALATQPPTVDVSSRPLTTTSLTF